MFKIDNFSLSIISNTLKDLKTLKFIIVLFFFSLSEISIAQSNYIWHSPNGLDTVAQNKQLLYVELDTIYFENDLQAIISHWSEIDSIYFSHSASDTLKKNYVLHLDSSMSTANFRAIIHYLDSCPQIVKVSEILGDNSEFFTTPLIMIKLNNLADSVILKNHLTSHTCSVEKVYDYNDLIWFARVNNLDSNSIQISRELHETGLFDFAEPNFSFVMQNTSTTNDPLLGDQWHLGNTGSNHNNYPGCSLPDEDISAFDAWNTVTGCQYQTIAILDDGIWPFHTDLNCNNYGQNALLADPFYTYPKDYLNYNAIPDDSTSKHGTRCAGIATAKGNNSLGIAGVAYNTKVVGIKITTIDKKSSCIAIAAAYDLAKTFDVDIVSGSFAIYHTYIVRDFPFNSYMISQSINDLAINGRNGLGTPIVQSTGNGNFSHLCQTGTPIVGFPASDSNTIAVTSSDYCGGLVTDAYFSYCADYGGNTFIAAPGVEVLTTNVDFFGGPYYNYSSFEGTSAATPIVSGVIGLMFAANPMLNYRQVKSILANSADQISYTYNSTYIADHPWRDWSPEFGYGRANAEAAANLAKNTKFTLYSNFSGTISEITGSNITLQTTDILNFKLKIKIPSSMTSYVGIAWYRNGVKIAEDVDEIHPEMPGTYMVKVTNHCTDFAVSSQDLDVIFNCATINNYFNTTITTSPLSGQPYTMEGVIHIGGNVTFTDCVIMMKSGSEIIIDPGYTLKLTNTHVSSCDRWIGIRAQFLSSNRGLLIMEKGSSVSKALVGVMLENGGYILADSSKFEDNELHMAFDNYGPFHLSRVTASKFGMLSSVSGNTHPHAISNTLKSMVYMDQIEDIEFENNIFSSINKFGLTTPTDIEMNEVSDVTIEGNTFVTDNYYSLHITESESVDILRNSFNYKNLPVSAVPGSSYDYNAIYAIQSEAIDIQENSFIGCSEAVQFYQNINLPAFCDISENLFLYNNNALIISPIEHPLYASSGANENCSTYVYQIRMNIYCNKFEENTAAILGSGNLSNQGTLSFGAANNFINNTDWDLLWKDCNSYFNYYDNRSPYANSTTSNPAYTMNGVSMSIPEFTPVFSTSNLSCVSLLIVLSTDNQNSTMFGSSISTYPNPFRDIAIVENHSNKITNCNLYNTLGNIVESFTIDKNSKKEVDLSKLPAGVYFLRTDTGANLRLVKTN